MYTKPRFIEQNLEDDITIRLNEHKLNIKGQLHKGVMSACSVELQKNRDQFIFQSQVRPRHFLDRALRLGQAIGASVAARTDLVAGRRGQNRLTLSCNSTRHACVTPLGFSHNIVLHLIAVWQSVHTKDICVQSGFPSLLIPKLNLIALLLIQSIQSLLFGNRENQNHIQYTRSSEYAIIVK